MFRLLALACVGMLCGLVVSEAFVYGDPAKAKRCGDPTTGARNNNCNTMGPNKDGCIGFSCKLMKLGYRTCTGTGGTCEDDKETQCSGTIRDKKGCKGPVVLDSGGDPMTCQSPKFKYCKP